MASNLNAKFDNFDEIETFGAKLQKNLCNKNKPNVSTLMAISLWSRLVLFCVHCSLWLFQQFENAT